MSTATASAAASAVPNVLSQHPPESFAALFEESLLLKEMRQGEVITAEVVRVDPNYVVVNAGLKSESYIPVEEFHNDHGEVEVQAGDFVSVAIESLEDGHGETRLSRDKAKRLAAWLALEDAHNTGSVVQGMVNGAVKGGLTVMMDGIRAFLPGSLVDLRPVKDTSAYQGKLLDFKVIKLDRKRNNVVVSRRAVLEQTQGAERQQLLETLKEGSVVKGIVKNITDYGAFVDLGGIDGLLHITDLAWRRVKHPSEVLAVGDEVEAKVLKFDQEKNRVSLGLKQLGEDPWVGISRRYPSGTRLFGKVSNITDYGAFVEIEQGIEGLVHVSEMDWTNKNVNPGRVVQVGEEVEVLILVIDEDRPQGSVLWACERARAAGVLPRAFAEARFDFYGRTLFGVPEDEPRWKRGLELLDGELGMTVGRLYVERHFSARTRADIVEMVENIRAAFVRRIDALAWMAPDTKAQAKAKVAVLEVGIGHPDTWPDLSALTIADDDLFGNVERTSRENTRRQLAKLGQTPDRRAWCMNPHEVTK
jgi:predicted RNA-binding protein with RPS1 domain